MDILNESRLSILPWQKKQWQNLKASQQQSKLPHALLIHGPAGLGKAHFALLFAQSLFCETPTELGVCGQCRSCRWFARGHHPDCVVLQPQANKKQIGIDQVRDIIRFLQLKSHSRGAKLVILNPAEKMLNAAANSLLKTLEEPPGDSLLILLSQQPRRLLPTLRSRCQQLHFPPERSDLVISWLGSHTGKTPKQVAQCLALAQGAPLTAVDYLRQGVLDRRDLVMQEMLSIIEGKKDPIKLAAAWLKTDLDQPLTWIGGALLDTMRLQFSDQPPYLCHPDWQKQLRQLAGNVSKVKVQLLGRRVNKAIQLLQTSINAQMLIENLLIEFTKVSRTA